MHRLKHYFINVYTGLYSTDSNRYLTLPNIPGLSISYQLIDSNNIRFCLSTAPSHIEKNEILTIVGFSQIQSDPNVAITTSYEVSIIDQSDPLGIATTIGYNVTYTIPNHIPIQTGITTLSLTEWNNEISDFDNRQLQKRTNFLSNLRDSLLDESDWVLVRSQELSQPVGAAYTSWRNKIRNITNNVGILTELPPLPTVLQNDPDIKNIYNNFYRIKEIIMINDTIP